MYIFFQFVSFQFFRVDRQANNWESNEQTSWKKRERVSAGELGYRRKRDPQRINAQTKPILMATGKKTTVPLTMKRCAILLNVQNNMPMKPMLLSVPTLKLPA